MDLLKMGIWAKDRFRAAAHPAGWHWGEEGESTECIAIYQADLWPKEEFHIIRSCELRDSGVQLGGHKNRSTQIWIDLANMKWAHWSRS